MGGVADTEPDGYLYDVFVSYPRGGDVEPWVRKHLVPRLKSALQENLARQALFIDNAELHTGLSWPDALEFALRRSRCLLSVFSRQYFKKPWCRAELDSMVQRHPPTGPGRLTAPNILVHAIVAHDCSEEAHVPEPYRHIQRANFKDWVYDFADTDWAFFKGFQDDVARLAERIAFTVDLAPEWRPDFPIVRPDVSPVVAMSLPKL
jgi:hypothetical protein